MYRKHSDLQVISAIAIIGAILAITGLHLGAWLSVFGILMVFVLPGYLFSHLLLPRIPFAERLLVSLALSIVIAGFSGLLLNLFPLGLTPVTWGIWLAIVTLAGVFFLWRRREAELALPFTFSMPKIAWQTALPYVLTLALIVLALGIAQAGSNQLNAPLTVLWANMDPAHPQVLDIGVRNEEKSPMIYNIVVQQNGIKVNEWAVVTLNPGTTFTGQFTFSQPPTQPATVLLYRSDQPGTVYRQVRIDFAHAIPISGK